MTEDLEAVAKSALSSRYRISYEVGSGGMASVFAAHDLELNRGVAVKVLRPELARQIGEARFQREIEIMADLEHDRILPLLDAGAVDGTLYYTMPLEVETLRQRLERDGQLPVDEAVAIARDVAEALEFVHSQGWVHRDVTPSNIFLSEKGACLGDFGLARALGGRVGRSSITSGQVVLGTPQYMSPEQIGDTPRVGPASDIYSLGCVLYEMLAGRPPFQGESHRGVWSQHITSPVPNVRRSSVGARLESLVRKALEKVPADRFHGASELRAALDDPRLLEPATLYRRLRLGESRAGLWAVGIAMVSLGTAFLLWPADDPSPEGRLLLLPTESTAPTEATMRGMVATTVSQLSGVEIVEMDATDGASDDGVTTLRRSQSAEHALRLTLIETSGVLQIAYALYNESGITRGSSERSADLADAANSVSVALARELGLKLTSLEESSRNPTAIINLVTGRRAFYRRDFDAAIPALTNAIAADSSYSAAYFWLGLVESWFPRWNYMAALDAIDLGLAREPSLPRAHRELLRAARAYMLHDAEGSISMAGQAAQRYPFLVEADWLQAEALYHYGAFAGQDRAVARAPLERVLAHDSAFAPVFQHLATITMQSGDSAASRVFVNRIAADREVLDRYESAWDLRFGTPGRRSARLSMLDQAEVRTLAFLVVHFARGADDLTLADSIAGILMSPGRPPTARLLGGRYRFAIRSSSGSWRSGLEAWESVAGSPSFDPWVVQARLAGLPVDRTAAPMIEGIGRRVAAGELPDFELEINHPSRQAFRSYAHWTSLSGDSSDVGDLLGRLAAASGSASSGDPFPFLLTHSLEARLAILSGDTIRAVDHLSNAVSRVAEPHVANFPSVSMAPQRLMLVRLLAATGDLPGARRWASSFRRTNAVADRFFDEEIADVLIPSESSDGSNPP